MNWQAYRHSRRAVGLTVAASAALAALGAGSTPARAQGADTTQTAASGINVSILSPTQSASFVGAKKIEVSAFYQSSTSGIQSIDLDIDGVKAATKTLDNPEMKGIISFLIDPSTLTSGSHTVIIHVYSADGDEAVANASFHYSGDLDAQPAATDNADGAPSFAIANITDNQKVNGLVTIRVNVHDPSGRTPYVSLFIDNVFKTLRNYGPYTFNWDTTGVANGMHTISVSGFSDESQIGKSQVLHVFVNNVGGDTIINQGLSDTTGPSSTPPPAPLKSKTPVQQELPLSDSIAGQQPAGEPAMDFSHGQAPQAAVRMPDQLASANLQDNGIAEETYLNAPFLQRKAPVTPDEIVPRTPASLASPVVPGVPNYSHAAQKLASASVDADDLTAEAFLSAPVLKPQAAPAVRPAAPAPVAERLPQIEPEASFVAPAPAPHPAPVVVAHAPTAPASHPAPVVVAHAPSTQVAMPAGEARMASTPPILKVTVSRSDLQMASASLPGSVDGSILKAPEMTRMARPGARRAVDLTRVVHHSANVFSREVVDRVRGSYVVMMDDRSVSLDEPLQNRHHVLYAPLRRIFESKGESVDWVGKSKEVKIETASGEVTLKIGSRVAMLDGRAIRLDTAPYILHNRTMIPVGFLPIALNVTVGYDAASGHLTINKRA